MSLPVIIRPPAEADIQQSRETLEAIRAGLGAPFMSRLRQLFERIEAMPEMYGLVWMDVRAVRLKQFRYVVYYVVFTDRVEVVAVMHAARDASLWQSRV